MTMVIRAAVATGAGGPACSLMLVEIGSLAFSLGLLGLRAYLYCQKSLLIWVLSVLTI